MPYDYRKEDSHKLRKEIERELMEQGLSSDLGVPPPTKKELSQAKGSPYKDHEIQCICDLLIKHKGNIDDTLAEIVEKRQANREYPIRLLDRPRLLAFVNNHIDDFYKAARTSKALPAILKLCEEADQSSVMLGAAKEIANRADGMPTQRIETTVTTFSWADVEAERAKTQEMLQKSQPDGEWVKEPEPNTPVATDE